MPLLAQEMSHLKNRLSLRYFHNFTNSYSSTSLFYLIHIQMISVRKAFYCGIYRWVGSSFTLIPNKSYKENTLKCTWVSYIVMQKWNEIGDLGINIVIDHLRSKTFLEYVIY